MSVAVNGYQPVCQLTRDLDAPEHRANQAANGRGYLTTNFGSWNSLCIDRRRTPSPCPWSSTTLPRRSWRRTDEDTRRLPLFDPRVARGAGQVRLDIGASRARTRRPIPVGVRNPDSITRPPRGTRGLAHRACPSGERRAGRPGSAPQQLRSAYRGRERGADARGCSDPGRSGAFDRDAADPGSASSRGTRPASSRSPVLRRRWRSEPGPGCGSPRGGRKPRIGHAARP